MEGSGGDPAQPPPRSRKRRTGPWGRWTFSSLAQHGPSEWNLLYSLGREPRFCIVYGATTGKNGPNSDVITDSCCKPGLHAASRRPRGRAGGRGPGQQRLPWPQAFLKEKHPVPPAAPPAAAPPAACSRGSSTRRLGLSHHRPRLLPGRGRRAEKGRRPCLGLPSRGPSHSDRTERGFLLEMQTTRPQELWIPMWGQWWGAEGIISNITFIPKSLLDLF